MGRISTGAACIAAIPLRQKGKSTPASIAAAIPSGMAAIKRPKGRKVPVSKIRPAARTKAPTACGMVTPVVAAINAAPGVDHARTTGTRAHVERTAEPMALATLTARTQLAVCSGLAPTAAAAANTSAIVEP